jgi:hypothetical protein
MPITAWAEHIKTHFSTTFLKNIILGSDLHCLMFLKQIYAILCRIGIGKQINKINSSFHMNSYTFSPTTITNKWSPNNIAENTTRCTNWFTTSRSSCTLPSHRNYTHNPKPNKPVIPQLATNQQLQVHATHTKICYCSASWRWTLDARNL